MTHARGTKIVTLITVLRIVLVVPIMVLITREWWAWKLLGLISMLICEASDFADGGLARRWQVASKLGAILDPYADSLYRCGVFLAMTSNGWLDLWMMAVFFGRDLTNAYIRAEVGIRQIAFGARTWGKIKAWAQGLAQCFTLYFYVFNEWELQWLGWWLLLGATLVTAYSWIDYIRGWLQTKPPGLGWR